MLGGEWGGACLLEGRGLASEVGGEGWHPGRLLPWTVRGQQWAQVSAAEPPPDPIHLGHLQPHQGSGFWDREAPG